MLNFISIFVDTTQVILYLVIFVGVIVALSYIINKFKPAWFGLIFNIFNKPLFYVFMLLVLISVGLYYTSMQDVKKIALMEYNREQLEENIKQQQLMMERQQKISDMQLTIQKQLSDQNEKLTAKLSTIDRYLSSDDAKKANRPSSDVLRNTLRMLSEKK